MDDKVPPLTKLTGNQHRRINENSRDRIYVVGDVHGCFTELEELLDRLDPAPDDLVVFTGDLIRKGPNSNRVLNLIRSREQLISVRGNNEQEVIDGRKEMPGLTPENQDFIRTLPVAISWDKSLVVHGGVNPDKPFRDQTADELITFRSVDGEGYGGRLWFEEYYRPVRVYFGHTVLAEPFVHDAFVGLDTGCVYGGTLCAYIAERDELIQVDSERTVVERDENCIISNEDVDRNV